MAQVNRKELRRRVGQSIKVRGKRALAAAFVQTGTGSASQVVSASVLGGFPNEPTYFNDARVSVVGGTRSGETRDVDVGQATPFDRSTGTLKTIAFSGNLDATSEVEIWRFGLDADVVNRAINIAIDEVAVSSLVLTQATAFATESGRAEYPLPSNLDLLYRVQVSNKSPLAGHSTQNSMRAFGTHAVRAKVGQKFRVKAGHPIRYVAVQLAKAGSPADNVQVVLESDYESLPTYVWHSRPIYSDTFSGTNGDALPTYNSNWQLGGSGVIEIQDGKAKTRTSSLNVTGYAVVETGVTDQVVEADLTIPAASSFFKFGLVARYVDTNNWVAAIFHWTSSGDVEMELLESVAGVPNVIRHNSLAAGGGSTNPFTAGAVIRMRLHVNGTTARAFMDDAAGYGTNLARNFWLEATTNVTSSAGTKAGLYNPGEVTPAIDKPGTWDNFAVYRGDFTNTSSSVAGSSILTTPVAHVFEFTPPLVPENDTDYHLIVQRTGSVDADNYYLVAVDEDGGLTDGNAEVYNSTQSSSGTTQTAAPYWTALSGVDLCFAVCPDPEGDWIDWPASGWHIEREGTPQLALNHKPLLDVGLGWYPSIYEGRPVRLFGYRDAEEPTSDTSTIEANPNYILNEVVLRLLATDVGGPAVDPDDHARQMAYWQRVVELQRERRSVKTRLMPNTVRIRDHF